MKNNHSRLASVAVLGAVAALTMPMTATAADRAPVRGTEQADAIPGRYVVVMEQGAPKQAADDARRQARNEGGRISFTYDHTISGFAAQLPPRALEAMRSNPNVAYIEADQKVALTATQSTPTWGLDRVDQRNLPLSSSYTYNATGSGVTAYIIDTGIRSTHGEFGGRVGSGYTAISDGNGSADCNGHGTHVAGTVGGTTYGVAKSVTLKPVRVLGCDGSGTNSGVIAGVDWVTGNKTGPAVANMSLGGGVSSALDSAVQSSINAGVSYAVAAGNDSGANACNGSPSRVGAALTVGSSTNTDARSSFSNYGSCVDLFAPGSSITSAWIGSSSATNTISGTSMASPHVAGAAALYLQGSPGAGPATVASAILGNASTNKVSGVNGSPNRLLFTNPSGGGTTPPPTGGQLVVNGGFESGATGWSGNTGVIGTSGYAAASGSAKAWLNGYGQSSSEQVNQSVTIPSSVSSATLTFKLRVDSAESGSTAYDYLRVYAGSTVVGTWSNVNETTGYLTRTISLTAYRGQTVNLRFSGTEDSTLQTSFLVDDVSVTTS